jgi:hypothetical protein
MSTLRLSAALVVMLAAGSAILLRAADAPASPATALEALPAVVRQAVQERTKGAELRDVHRRPAIYTARLDFHGQKSEVRVNESGKILRNRTKQEAEANFEEEQRLAQAGKLRTISLADLPEPARAAITARTHEAKLEQIGVESAVTTVAATRSGKPFAFGVADDGTVTELPPAAGSP